MIVVVPSRTWCADKVRSLRESFVVVGTALLPTRETLWKEVKGGNVQTSYAERGEGNKPIGKKKKAKINKQFVGML